MATWDAWGLVVGESLPNESWTVPGVLEIHPGDVEEVASLKKLRPDVLVDFRPPDPYHFDVSGAPIHVESPWVLHFGIDAEDSDTAKESALSAAALYESILSTSAPDATQPFHVEILAVVNQETGDGEPLPATWHVHPVKVATMSDELAGTLERRLTLASRDDGNKATVAARAAAQLLRDATYLADTSMDVALLENASLLLYFQVVEGIAQFVVKGGSAEPRDSLDAARVRLVSEMVTALSGTLSPEESSRLVHKTDYELRQVEATHLRQRIKDAGAIVGLPEPEIDEAIALLQVRNGHLAHFGATLPREEYIHWFHQRGARRIAIHFYAGFLDWVLTVDEFT